jgi:hypothetical protein
MYFIAGYAWALCGSCLLMLIGVSFPIHVLSISLFLQTLYAVTFWPVYKQQKIEVIIPALSLITLQVFTFLTFLFFFMAKHWPLMPVLWTLIIFFGTLLIQVIEQSKYLKRLQKPQQ